MIKAVMSCAAVALLAGSAQAGVFAESEGNNTVGTANFLGVYGQPGGSILVDGHLSPGGGTVAVLPGDVDWFSFTVTGPSVLVASIFTLTPGTPNYIPDSQLILIDAFGNILATNDDGNPGGGSIYMSSIAPISLAAGTYFIGVTGYNDLSLPGPGPNGLGNVLPDGLNASGSPHTEDFDYKLIIGLNIVPTPSAAALLGLGGLVAGRRRRARHMDAPRA